MGLDFEVILVLATALSGLIWAFDAAFFARRRREHARRREAEDGERAEPVPEPTLVEYARSFFPVLLVVLVLRSFLAEPFRIPSPSMLPTLEVGDFIVVNKLAYGIRLPVTHSEIIETGRPERGDVAVFRYPRQPSLNYIKRVVGVPGDKLSYRNRRLFINGDPVPVERLGDYRPAGNGDRLLEFQERIGDTVHSVLLDPDARSPEGDYTVPDGQYFVLGDNRDHSNDSRSWGYVPAANLVGEAEFIWMHWDWTGSNGGVDWSRIGNGIE